MHYLLKRGGLFYGLPHPKIVTRQLLCRFVQKYYPSRNIILGILISQLFSCVLYGLLKWMIYVCRFSKIPMQTLIPTGWRIISFAKFWWEGSTLSIHLNFRYTTSTHPNCSCLKLWTWWGGGSTLQVKNLKFSVMTYFWDRNRCSIMNLVV